MLSIEREIELFKKKHNAILLAHYYQDTEIHEVADHIGDALALLEISVASSSDVIIVCGSKFIAESIAVLNPHKKILIPDLNAGCSVASSCNASEFLRFKNDHPGYIALTSINSSLEVKALSDIIVTSSNAAAIINDIPQETHILFAPDKNMGRYLIEKTGRDMRLWHGECIVHKGFSERELLRIKTAHPRAQVLANSGCKEALLEYANYIGSEADLVNYVKDYNGLDFIILAEPGIIGAMHKVAPNSMFYDVPHINEAGIAACSECPYMRLNTLEKLYETITNFAPLISVESVLANAVRVPLKKMLSYTRSLI